MPSASPVIRKRRARASASSTGRWILLIHQIPPKPDYLRVKISRRLQRIGAVAIKNSVYVLPAGDATLEDFQWVLREITTEGGEKHVMEALSLGAKGYIRKPFTPDQVKEHVIPVLGR